MAQTKEQETILGYQGGNFLEYTDEESGIDYTDAAETISVVSIDPSSQTFLAAMDLFLSFQQFRKGDEKKDQTGAAHKSRAQYKQKLLQGWRYKWLINTNWEAIANYLAIVRGVIEMSDEEITNATRQWMIESGIPIEGTEFEIKDAS